jgi:hypothetical protein
VAATETAARTDRRVTPRPSSLGEEHRLGSGPLTINHVTNKTELIYKI